MGRLLLLGRTAAWVGDGELNVVGAVGGPRSSNHGFEGFGYSRPCKMEKVGLDSWFGHLDLAMMGCLAFSFQLISVSRL